ncbi:hypothetical protein [Streptomyces californicus]|uniref:hypothetical protein n=1 Tax=Streptomyces californicus TaxID=67351 RepID=UPI003723A5A6
MSQRTVSDWSGVSAGTLKNLARIGLLPDADNLRPHDVVLARVAHTLGATRSTNRETQQGERTTTAFQRDWDAVRVVMELLLAAEDHRRGEAPAEVDRRTRLVAFPETVALVVQDYELLQLCEKALDEGLPLIIMTIGAWHAELQQRLAGTFEGDMRIAA